jgi:hypothetical protein
VAVKRSKDPQRLRQLCWPPAQQPNVKRARCRTPVLHPSETYRIRVRVLSTVAAEQSSLLTRLFTFRFQNDSAEKDAVKLTVSRT